MIITETIKEKTAQVKSFSIKETTSKNYAEQKKINLTYRDAITNVCELVSEVVNSCDASNFTISDDISSRLTELFGRCSETSNKSKVETSDVNAINAIGNEVRSALQYEWSSYYDEETSSVIEVLNVIKGIANVDVNSLLSEMQAAKQWNAKKEIVLGMMNAISAANSQIDEMKLTDNTVEFLRKVIAKTATLEDLTDEVMDWIRSENIERKVKITF